MYISETASQHLGTPRQNYRCIEAIPRYLGKCDVTHSTIHTCISAIWHCLAADMLQMDREYLHRSGVSVQVSIMFSEGGNAHPLDKNSKVNLCLRGSSTKGTAVK